VRERLNEDWVAGHILIAQALEACIDADGGIVEAGVWNELGDVMRRVHIDDVQLVGILLGGSVQVVMQVRRAISRKLGQFLFRNQLPDGDRLLPPS
jgi:hypothetical protein